MSNNDVLRRIRYTFDFRDQTVIDIFAFVNVTVTLSQVKNWLRKDDDAEMVELADEELSSFLNGFIIERRGKRDGDLPKQDKTLTKNLILMKLKIALSLQADDIIAMFKANDFIVGKAELSAFFRKPDHKNYRLCKAQFLRNFLQGVQDKYRAAPAPKSTSTYKKSENKAPVEKEQTHKQRDSKPSNNKGKSYSGDKPAWKKKAKPAAKTIYVNPNATTKAKSDNDKSERKVLKLKPSDIYKDA